ncbi:MAG: tRNA preQ1(34) S-adenosylmethionine ribosyltransferase-isomerase QueA [Candidatus Acidiferrales bacterium]
MKLSDLDYVLPREIIAQQPLEQRDASRLLLVDRGGQRREDRLFRDLPEILRGDELLVVNNARVIPARLFGRRAGVAAKPPSPHSHAHSQFLTAPIEVLLTRQIAPDVWEALVRPGRKIRPGEWVIFGEGELKATVVSRGDYGLRRLRFSGTADLRQAIERLGHVPLPPYIDRPDQPADRERYQTIFARRDGAIAAPTAGLHFTPEILERIRGRRIELCEITLQVGLGTFQPIRCENLENHKMRSEAYEISAAAAAKIAEAWRHRRPILAVGTTVVRALEDAAAKARSRRSATPRTRSEEIPIEPGQAVADIFIFPGFEFRLVDQLLTNFHLPKSSLLALVAAFAGREYLLQAYRHAIERRYRFYSYGDCMLLR